MDLPVRIVTEALTDPVINVDGIGGSPGLHLSHWPGQRTPRALRHRLSTGSALAFARLDPEERRRLAGGAVAIVNNHYDTDGVCALYAVRHPALALRIESELLEAAEAGDFHRLPSEEAFVLDAIVTGLSDPERSPLAAELRGLTDTARWELCVAHLFERLPALVRGEVEDYGVLWRPALASVRADLSSLGLCDRTEFEEEDLTLWSAPMDGGSSRTRSNPPKADSSSPAFDPGRHALFGSTRRDRALVSAPCGDGTTYRLVISTLSWFDLPELELHPERRMPRPDLKRLAARLDELGGTTPEDAHAWRAQASDNASPELWFGRRELATFSEHNPALAPSALGPDSVLAEVRMALARPQTTA